MILRALLQFGFEFDQCLATIWMDVSDNQDGCCCGVQPEGGRSPTVG